MKSKLIGKRVIVNDKESIYHKEWGIVALFDGDYYHVKIANGEYDTPIFSRNQLRVPRKQNKPF